MDDMKLFAKSEKELETLIQCVRIYSPEIGREFGKEKCAMLLKKSDKRHMTEGVELPNQVVIRTLEEKKAYKYWDILETDTIKQAEMKEIFFKVYPRGTRKLLETKLYSRNLANGINTWSVPLVR